jgi:hypothetical protein
LLIGYHLFSVFILPTFFSPSGVSHHKLVNNVLPVVAQRLDKAIKGVEAGLFDFTDPKPQGDVQPGPRRGFD